MGGGPRRGGSCTGSGPSGGAAGPSIGRGGWGPGRGRGSRAGAGGVVETKADAPLQPTVAGVRADVVVGRGRGRDPLAAQKRGLGIQRDRTPEGTERLDGPVSRGRRWKWRRAGGRQPGEEGGCVPEPDAMEASNEIDDIATRRTACETEPAIEPEIDRERGGVVAAVDRTRPDEAVPTTTQSVEDACGLQDARDLDCALVRPDPRTCRVVGTLGHAKTLCCQARRTEARVTSRSPVPPASSRASSAIASITRGTPAVSS